MSTAAAKPGNTYDLTMTRTFHAPRQLVFDAWTKPEMVAQWWGPRGFTCTLHSWEARTGGNILLDMHGPSGIDHPMSGRFEEFDPPARIVFTAVALDKDGKAMFENRNSLQFEEIDGETRVTLEVKVMSATAVASQYLNAMSAGWSSSLERLADLVQERLS